MKFAALEDYLRKQVPSGSESTEILEKFLLYAKLVQDPLNVFRYMEEHAICIYFPLFWYTKSEYLVEIGDYRNAFLCLKKTEEMKPIHDTDERSKLLNVQIKSKIYREQIAAEMRRFPPNKRRTVSDFNIISNRFDDMPGSEEEKNEQMFNLLEKTFPLLRIDKEKTFEQRNESKPKSWLFDIYEKQQMKVIEYITETFLNHGEKDDNSVSNTSLVRKSSKQSHERLFRSLNTPFKRKDPMRIDKTLDSVEMMKRRRRTEELQEGQKTKKNYFNESGKLDETFNQDDSEFENQEEQISRCYNTVPVGKSMKKKKKHVKFENPRKSLRIELPRNNQNMEKADDVIEVSRRTTPHKGILKNKSMEKKEAKESIFPNLTERSLKLKQTDEREFEEHQSK